MTLLRPLAGLAVAAVVALSACDQPPAKGGAKQGGPGPHLVEVATVAVEPLSHATTRTGTLAARRIVRLFNQEEGRIEALEVRAGDAVRAGQVLVRLDRRLLAAELEKVVANRRQAESDLARARALSARAVATQERVDRAETAVSVIQAEERLIRTRLGYGEIQAPFDGVVSERLIEPGDVAARHSHLLTLIDPASLYTNVSVSELMLPRLRVGDPAEVRIDALGQRAWTARIGRIHPTVDPRTRQGVVEVELTPVPPGAAPGQLSRVTLRTPASPRKVVPFAALRQDREGEHVYVVADGKAAVRRVRTGLRLKDRIEVLDGVEAGDHVIVRGFLDLGPGKAVQVVDKAGDGVRG